MSQAQNGHLRLHNFFYFPNWDGEVGIEPKTYRTRRTRLVLQVSLHHPDSFHQYN